MKIRLEFHYGYYPVKSFRITIHGYFNSFAFLHILYDIGEMRYYLSILYPLSREQYLFTRIFLAILVCYQYLNEIKVELLVLNFNGTTLIIFQR